MFEGKPFCLLALVCLHAVRVSGILSKGGSPGEEERSDPKADNVAAQSIDRDYVAGIDGHYGQHGGYGLSAHAADYGLSGAHEGYGVHEESKPHVHHPEDLHHHHHHHLHHGHHKHHDYAYHKALAIKGLLVPLAGVALLGAAAAFVSNPILLQLGVISGTSLGRRKRDTKSGATPLESSASLRLNEIKLLERFMAQVPEEEIQAREKKMLADFLSCSRRTGRDLCLERLACELHSPEGRSMPTEANVLTIVVNEVLGNDLVPEETKARLSEAVDRGRRNLSCEAYTCHDLEDQDGIQRPHPF